MHRALNLVYTFCCTRKHLATTLDNIKAAVEGHLRRELTVEDVAQVKALVPRAINFAYVDEASLQVHEPDEQQQQQRGRPGARQTAREDFRLPPCPKDIATHGCDGGDQQPQQSQQSQQQSQRRRELLLFEFVDGDLKRQQKRHATTTAAGEPANLAAIQRQRRREEELRRMPVFSQKQMTNLINKRNTKFDSAVNAFLNQCASDGEADAVAVLARAAQQYVPLPADEEEKSGQSGTAAAPASPPTIPTPRKSIAEIVAEIKAAAWYTGQIVPDGHRVFAAQPAVYGELEFALSQGLVNALFNSRGIRQLYAHQAAAINDLVERRRHVIVSTPTSSGKSLIYQVPVLHALERDRSTRAMYIFPTKALAQDQKRSLQELLSYMDGLQDVVVETFDGDTPMHERNRVRDEARIIFTNPDMLHVSILPHEESWRAFLKNLKYVVVDGGFLPLFPLLALAAG